MDAKNTVGTNIILMKLSSNYYNCPTIKYMLVIIKRLRVPGGSETLIG